MKKFSLRAGVLLAFLVTGCTFLADEYESLRNTGRVYEHRVPLNEADYDAFLGEGTAVISGEISVENRDGKIIHGDTAFIYLVPATPYTQEWFEHYVVQDHKIGGTDPRSFQATRTTVVGTAGRFQFPNIPAGNYYLLCPITPERQTFRFLWVTEAKPAGETINAHASVTVKTGEQVKVPVTQLGK